MVAKWGMVVLCRLPDGKQHFIEVKSSRTAKTYFDMSVAELHHASEWRENFTIFRVCGVGTPQYQVVKINDPVSKIEQGLIRICVILPSTTKAG